MRRIRVLVVDDSALMRVLISDMLNEDDDMVIGVARNGEEAVKKALSLHPDVITMDVDMPKMDGITAVERIIAREKIPIVMLSGYTKSNARTTIEASAARLISSLNRPECFRLISKRCTRSSSRR